MARKPVSFIISTFKERLLVLFQLPCILPRRQYHYYHSPLFVYRQLFAWVRGSGRPSVFAVLVPACCLWSLFLTIWLEAGTGRLILFCIVVIMIAIIIIIIIVKGRGANQKAALRLFSFSLLANEKRFLYCRSIGKRHMLAHMYVLQAPNSPGGK